jgi:hypothetical protein
MLGFDIGYGFDRFKKEGGNRVPDPGWKTTLTFGQQF